jgi:uncharacterized membrane protein
MEGHRKSLYGKLQIIADRENTDSLTHITYPYAIPMLHRLLLLLLLLLGLTFRWVNLDGKVYWHDEVFTTVRVLGFTGQEIETTLLAQPLVTAQDLQRFQTRSTEKSWGDTFRALQTHPEHPPLFYLMARAWVDMWGSSVAAVRALSALWGVVLLPLVYWFCWQLFANHRLSAVAMALVAVSPIQVLYAQEARQYSLWCCVWVLCSGLLLSATGLRAANQSAELAHKPVNSGTYLGWIGYAVALALNFYCTPLSVFLIFAHGLFVLLAVPRRYWAKWMGAILLAVLLFVPWLGVMLSESKKLDTVTQWAEIRQPLAVLVKFWGLHLSSAVVDLGLPLEHGFTAWGPPWVLLLVVGCFGLGWWRYRGTPLWRSLLLVAVLIVIPALGLILPDLIEGAQRSIMTRYFLPELMMVSIAIAIGLSVGIGTRELLWKLLGYGLLGFLLSLGVTSCLLSARADTWWNKGVSYHIPRIAEVVNAADRPLLLAPLTANGLGNAISLSYQVLPETQFLIFRPDQLPELPAGYSNYYMPYATGKLIAAVTAKYQRPLVAVEMPGVYELWELGGS